MITITGTPRWANGNQSPNHPPLKMKWLTEFAQMLAHRYNGEHGRSAVTLFSVWNEPNLGLFLVPQFRHGRIVSPALYARLFRAAYTGIKKGDPNAIVAAGETSNRGINRPTGNPGRDSVAPATFARRLAEVAPRLPFAAWADHPYSPNFGLDHRRRFGFRTCRSQRSTGSARRCDAGFTGGFRSGSPNTARKPSPNSATGSLPPGRRPTRARRCGSPDEPLRPHVHLVCGSLFIPTQPNCWRLLRSESNC